MTALAGCSDWDDETPDPEPSEPAGAASTAGGGSESSARVGAGGSPALEEDASAGTSGVANGGASAGGAGGSEAGEDASTASGGTASADAGSAIDEECVAAAEFTVPEVADYVVPMGPTYAGNHERPHSFAMTREQLEQALALDGPSDDAGLDAPKVIFRTTSGSGQAAVPQSNWTLESDPHDHPVWVTRDQARRLAAGEAVELWASSGGIAAGADHYHPLIVRLC